MERPSAITANNLTELSPPRAEDAAELFAVIDSNRARLRQWLPWIVPEYSIDDARSFLLRSAAEFEDRASLTLIIRHKGALCGAIGLHRLEIRCAVENHRSSAVPRRLGFLEEGILREAEWLYDHWVDLRVFSMLAQDWIK